MYVDLSRCPSSMLVIRTKDEWSSVFKCVLHLNECRCQDMTFSTSMNSIRITINTNHHSHCNKHLSLFSNAKEDSFCLVSFHFLLIFPIRFLALSFYSIWLILYARISEIFVFVFVVGVGVVFVVVRIVVSFQI